jgi:UDP-N-acetylglucosamine:LPS N-acetylglucosamine transferase
MNTNNSRSTNRDVICLVCSGGGHLSLLQSLSSTWRGYQHFWVSANKPDVTQILKNEELIFGYFPESRNWLNLLKNTYLALKIYVIKKPTHVISTGAGVAIPFLLLGKIFGIKTVYIEPIDFLTFPTVTGKIVYYFVDKFIVLNSVQTQFYSKAVYIDDKS